MWTGQSRAQRAPYAPLGVGVWLCRLGTCSVHLVDVGFSLSWGTAGADAFRSPGVERGVREGVGFTLLLALGDLQGGEG